ncbi:MAG: hypothetical protein DBY09_00255 [Selenomonadales bacterium]|nr:MAG: hypothetical protein DBY09_00255 [Selenomonadales bacterium]
MRPEPAAGPSKLGPGKRSLPNAPAPFIYSHAQLIFQRPRPAGVWQAHCACRGRPEGPAPRPVPAANAGGARFRN